MARITGRNRAEEKRERQRRDVMEARRTLLAELSTPLTSLGKGIVVMPLVGAMNEERVTQMPEALLGGVNKV